MSRPISPRTQISKVRKSNLILISICRFRKYASIRAFATYGGGIGAGSQGIFHVESFFRLKWRLNTKTSSVKYLEVLSITIFADFRFKYTNLISLSYLTRRECISARLNYRYRELDGVILPHLTAAQFREGIIFVRSAIRIIRSSVKVHATHLEEEKKAKKEQHTRARARAYRDRISQRRSLLE